MRKEEKRKVEYELPCDFIYYSRQLFYHQPPVIFKKFLTGNCMLGGFGSWGTTIYSEMGDQVIWSWYLLLRPSPGNGYCMKLVSKLIIYYVILLL